MTPSAYSALVVAERKALAKLLRMLKAWGSSATIAKVDSAWTEWRELAAKLDEAQEAR